MDELSICAQGFAEIKDQEKEFTERCKESAEKIKDVVDKLNDSLMMVLETNPAIKLGDNEYLSVKRSESTLSLTADRIREAICETITKEMLTAAAAAKKNGRDDSDVIANVLEEALTSVCRKVTLTPQFTKHPPEKMPPGKYVINAPPDIRSMCDKLKMTKDNLKKINKHKRDGKNQCAPKLEEYHGMATAAYARVLESLPTEEEEPVIKFEPMAELTEVEGEEMDTTLPPLPLGSAIPPPSSSQKKKEKTTKKRKTTITAPVEGLERPIKVMRKEVKPKGSKSAPAAVKPKDLVDAFFQVIEERYKTIGLFLKKRAEAAELAIKTLETLKEIRKAEAEAKAEINSDAPPTYVLQIK